MSEATREVGKTAQLAQDLFTAGANCAEAVWQACAEELGVDPGQLELGNRLAGGFGGGLGVQDLCGAVAGGIMALGYLYGRHPGGPRNPKLKSSCQQFCQQAKQELGSLHCRDLRDPNNRAQCGLIVSKIVDMICEQVKKDSEFVS